MAFWDAEESGTVGSKAYVTALLAEEKEKIKMYFNLDTVGSKNGTMLILDAKKDSLKKMLDKVADAQKEQMKGIVEVFDQIKFNPDSIPLQEFVLQSAQKTGYPVESDLLLSLNTDTTNFSIDIPTTGIVVSSVSSRPNTENNEGSEIIDFVPCYHQACDTVDKIDRNTLNAVIKVVNDVVQKYAF